MTSDATRAFLEGWGYEIRFRTHEWVECLILGDGETWVGRGADRTAALNAAVRAACPTPLAARLFARAVQQVAGEAAGDSARSAWPAPWTSAAERPRVGLDAAAIAAPPVTAGEGAASVTAEALARAPNDAGLGEALSGSAASNGAARGAFAAEPLAARELRPVGSTPSSAGTAPAVVPAPAGASASGASASAGSAIAERSPGQIAVIISRPAVPRSPSTAGTAGGFAGFPVPPAPPTMLEDRLPDPRVSGDPETSLEELDILMDRIRDCREELGLCAPDRQRLAMLAWICEARSHTDAFPDDLRIRDRVGAISRQLTEIGKTFWPGSVTALQLHIEPRDLPRHLLGGAATTWHRAAELSEQALRNKEHEDERRGFDVYGWADARYTLPRPLHGARLLESLVAQVEELSGSLETQASPADTSVRPDGVMFQRWVRQLRWLRCADVDAQLWARVAGRLRWWAFRREPALQVAARELEPSYLPPSSWASLLGQDPERRRFEQKMREVLETPPAIGEERESLVAWLVAALPYGDTHHANIVKLMAPYRERVEAVLPDELPDSDRRLRRRLLRLQEDLRLPPSEIKPAPLPEVVEAPDEGREVSLAPPGPETAPLPEELLAKVRPLTEGKRAVLVSNRRDPDLSARLQDAFRFATLDLKIAEARRLEALGETIQEGQYHLVLAATGFQSQGVDNVLARACRNAGVRYVRVNRGRPYVCLRAILARHGVFDRA
jgi:hypothetical protein